jgi:ATP-dependent RNA helicase DeaD
MDAAQGRSADDAASVIHPALAATLAARGYDVLTPVQLAVLDHAASGADLLVSAQTGSGKTVAFGMAIAPTLLDDQPRFGPAGQPLALVVAPTRELALQVQRELDWLFADAGVSTASSVGGMDIRTERRAIGRGAHIVVGTPGRLRDHITKGALDLSAIKAVVLDEADEMLDLGFREDLEFILGAAPAERRTLMFSATVPPAIAHLAKTFQRDAIRVTATASSERHADIEYQMLVVPADEREQAIVNALLYFDSRSTLVFCHTREAVKTLTTRLTGRGFDVVTLSGELSQAERTNALQAMRDGRARVCVATDVAARGLDLPNLDLVIHADLPSKPDTLLHRSGRTGRAGRKGICVLIVPVFRRAAAARVLKAANVEAITRGAPTTAEIAARYRQAILDAAVAAAPADAEEAKLGAELLARVSPEQVAALYVRQQQALRPVPEAVTSIAIPASTERGARTVERSREVGRDVRDDPRKADMQGGVWFTLSLGRKHRADPKWLLPMICKAGEVTKRDVGSIKIGDSETRFEISADKAQGFAESLARSGSGEKGVIIRPAGGDAGAGWTPSGAPRAAKPAHRPARAATPEAPSPAAAERPSRPDKKPYPTRSRPPVTAGWTPEGQEPRKRQARKPHRKGAGPT